MKGCFPSPDQDTTPMNQSDKSHGMSQKQRVTLARPSVTPDTSEAASLSSPASPARSLGGKDHTPNPTGAPKARIFVDDGSRPSTTIAPGSSKTPISEELTRKHRPGTEALGAPRKHLAMRPRGVGISHQSIEREL